MRIHHRHRWDLDYSQATALQRELASLVVDKDDFGAIHTVAGVDVGFPRGRGQARAAVAVLDFPRLSVVDQAVACSSVSFPYIPGLLSFREIPAVLPALQELSALPDLILCDGQGRAHPRRFGIACHLGVLLDLPTIGVAKSRLIGSHKAVPEEKGAWVPLCDRDECIGAVLRTRTGVSPLYISTGHRISLVTAIDHVLRCCPRYRLPETTRAANRLASG